VDQQSWIDYETEVTENGSRRKSDPQSKTMNWFPHCLPRKHILENNHTATIP